jgi:hypothetical protein
MRGYRYFVAHSFLFYYSVSFGRDTGRRDSARPDADGMKFKVRVDDTVGVRSRIGQNPDISNGRVTSKCLTRLPVRGLIAARRGRRSHSGNVVSRQNSVVALRPGRLSAGSMSGWLATRPDPDPMLPRKTRRPRAGLPRHVRVGQIMSGHMSARSS